MAALKLSIFVVRELLCIVTRNPSWPEKKVAEDRHRRHAVTERSGSSDMSASGQGGGPADRVPRCGGCRGVTLGELVAGYAAGRAGVTSVVAVSGFMDSSLK